MSMKYEARLISGRSHGVGGIRFEHNKWENDIPHGLYKELRNDTRFETRTRYVDSPAAAAKKAESAEVPAAPPESKSGAVETTTVAKSMESDLESMTKGQLAELAEKRGLKVDGKFGKKDLIAAIVAGEVKR